MKDTEEQIEEFLEPFKQELVLLTHELRAFLKKETQPTMELVGDSTISVNIGYGFTEKAWDCFCAIIVYSKHINISFPSGASLDDPQGLLQGTGKRVRHIKVKDLYTINNSEVMDLLLEARDKALGILEEKPVQKETVKTIVKPISGIKKRPKK